MYSFSASGEILGDESKKRFRFPLVIKKSTRQEVVVAAVLLLFAYRDWNFDEDVADLLNRCIKKVGLWVRYESMIGWRKGEVKVCKS